MRHERVTGTRFRLFPEYAAGYVRPETVLLSPPPGSIRVGPADDQFRVANAVDKNAAYEPPDYMPPYRDAEFAPARPDRDGHFDTIDVDAPQFLAAHVYGTARHTLDIWEGYLGHRVDWWHAPELPRLELVPVVRWNNAHSGPGFLETGYMDDERGRPQLFALNFDIIAHEVGHAILFSQVGAPTDRPSAEFLAFHESFSDLVALIGVLDFDSVRAKLFQQTAGNLYLPNLVNRLGAISDTMQIRIVSSPATMDDVRGLRLAPDDTWIDPLGLHRNQHQLGEPLSGAIFDCLVELYQDGLVGRRLIPPEADARGWSRADLAAEADNVRREHGRALARFASGFDLAMLEARHVVGLAMAHVIRTVHPDTLTFERIAARFLEGLSRLGEQVNLGACYRHFLRHGIDPGPLLRHATMPGGVTSVAVRPEADASNWPRTRDPAAFFRARRLMRHEHREKQTEMN